MLISPSSVNRCAQAEADLIVMSTWALGGPDRALLGTVADEVVRTAKRPVLLVRRDAPAQATPPS